MGWNFEQELKRKVFHASALIYVIIYLVLFYFISHKTALLVLSAILVLMIYFEYIRVELKRKIPFIHLLWQIKRRKERNKMGAEVFFALGIIICLAVFDLRVAIAAVLMSVFGDMASALFGKRFGKTKMKEIKHEPIQRKCWEGVVAELFVNLAIAYFFIRAVSDPTVSWFYTLFPHEVSLWPIMIVMAVVATITETAVNKLEDNLLVPIITGFAGQITLIIMLALI